MEDNNEKLSILEFKIQNALMYLNQANKILHEPDHKRPRSGCARLNIKDLKIINVCQKGIGCTAFEDMDSFLKCGNIDS